MMNLQKFLLRGFIYISLIIFFCFCQRGSIENISLPFDVNYENIFLDENHVKDNSEFIRDFESEHEISDSKKYFFTNVIFVDSIKFSQIIFLEYKNKRLVFCEIRAITDKGKLSNQIVKKFVKAHRSNDKKSKLECVSIKMDEDAGFERLFLKIRVKK